MEVTCPSCESRFNLAAGVKPDAKLRCSVCKNVFKVGDATSNKDDEKGASFEDEFSSASSADNLDDGFDLDSSESGETKKKSSKKVFIILLIALLLCGGGAGAWYFFFQEEGASQDTAGEGNTKNVERLTVHDWRQYYVQNEKIGPLCVIEGKVVNEFPTPKDLIKVEGILLDKDQKPLIAKSQLAGTVLSRFQLKVLGEEELESFLNNQIEILTKNANVAPGGEVPFMVVFYNPPANVASFELKIIDAQDTVQEE